jgi:hypothetical protein
MDSLLVCMTNVIWQGLVVINLDNFFIIFWAAVPKRYLAGVVRQFLRAVRSVMPRPVEEGEPLQHYVISPGLFFDSHSL